MSVHEEDANSLHFVIPMKPQANLEELSDEELEKVAGGTDIGVTISISVAVALSIAGGVLIQADGGWPK